MKLKLLLLSVVVLVMSYSPIYASEEKGAMNEKPGIVESQAIKVEATVEAVDHAKRKVTLRGPEGKIVTIDVTDEVKNLPQVKVGDLVTMEYIETVTIQVFAKGEVEPGTTTLTAMASAEPGEKPAGAVVDGVAVVVTIEAIDRDKQLVTLKGAEGMTKTVKARNPANLEKVVVGDEVRITYMEALGISVTKNPMAKMTTASGMAGGERVVFRKTADNFIVLYDSSSSMGDAYGQTDMKEIEAELQILKEKISTLPELDWQAGIYTFTPNWSLRNLKPYLSMRAYNKDEFMSAIHQLPTKPAGPTQLQGGLNELGPVLDKLSGKTVVFLFTDGQYSYLLGLPEPYELAHELAQKHDVCFKVISTEKDKKNYENVKAIASANECSEVIPFHGLVGHPEWLTDVLFNVMEAGRQKPMKKEFVGYSMQKVFFDFDKFNIKQESTVPLIHLSIFLKENPKSRVTLAGYADNVGSDEYNIELSKRRAESARAYLVDKMGVNKNRITLSWFGKSDPNANNDTESGRSENRRVVAIVTEK